MEDDMNISLGMIAVNRGLLTEAQVKKIIGVQRKTGKKFGQAALHLKLLKRAQIGELLAEQEEVNLDVGEILVLMGRLSVERLNKERRAFARQRRQ